MKGLFSSYFSRRLSKKKRVHMLGDTSGSGPLRLPPSQIQGTGLKQTRFGKYDLSPLRGRGLKALFWCVVLAFLSWLLWESAAAFKIF
jgi:hypothetical protein